MEEIVGKFENRMNRAPFILNWGTGLQLSEAFPHLAIISPCALNGNGYLPYLDHTVDIVILPSRSGDNLAEARRVAVAAVVQVEGLRSGRKDQLTASKERSKLKLRAEWHDDEYPEAVPAETSIIIPVYNKVEYTRNCLVQLQNTLPPNFRGEIIVIDDASTDETPTVLEAFAGLDARIKLLRNEQNMGFIRSCNRAAEAASGEVIVFLNNDTLPQSGWLTPLLKVLQDYPDAGAVGGKLIYSDGTLQEAGGVIFSDASGCNFGKHKSASAPLYNFLREVDYCSGALLATRRELFNRLGGFDTRYAPAYYEDTDYCFGLRERGYRVYYQPESVIIHFEGVSCGTDVNSGVKKYQEVNRTKFQDKWKHFLQHHPPPPCRYDFVTLHELSVRSWPRVNHEN
jgi:GT2 family glycosyltransferase